MRMTLLVCQKKKEKKYEKSVPYHSLVIGLLQVFLWIVFFFCNYSFKDEVVWNDCIHSMSTHK